LQSQDNRREIGVKVVKMKISEKDYPIVKCFVEGKSVKFWCPFCKRWHFHGYSENGELDGHRGAHCSEQTPFTETGYIVKPYTKRELKEMGFLKS
jgi:hypothetical protein